MRLEDVLILEHTEIGDPQWGIRRLVFQSAIAEEAEPGQFVQLKVSSGMDPLLRRPISIAAIDRAQKEITLLYRQKGKGTKTLAQAQPGERLNLLGPLGHGFTLPASGIIYLVAGGIGVFPLLALAQKAVVQGIPMRLFWGGENRSFLESAGLALWQELGISIEVSTLDGSLGVPGTVLDLLRSSKSASPAQVAVCGPQPMMAAVSAFYPETAVPVEVSLEERMGCGVGACLGCVCTLQDEHGTLRRGKVCKDGPVFPAKEVVWNADL